MGRTLLKKNELGGVGGALMIVMDVRERMVVMIASVKSWVAWN